MGSSENRINNCLGEIKQLISNGEVTQIDLIKALRELKYDDSEIGAATRELLTGKNTKGRYIIDPTTGKYVVQ